MPSADHATMPCLCVQACKDMGRHLTLQLDVSVEMEGDMERMKRQGEELHSNSNGLLSLECYDWEWGTRLSGF